MNVLQDIACIQANTCPRRKTAQHSERLFFIINTSFKQHN